MLEGMVIFGVVALLVYFAFFVRGDRRGGDE